LLPTFGSLSLAKAFAEKQIATRMTSHRHFPFAFSPSSTSRRSVSVADEDMPKCHRHEYQRLSY
jgi:hypothetical protein